MFVLAQLILHLVQGLNQNKQPSLELYPNVNTAYAIFSIKLLIYNLNTLCMNGTLSCVDLTDVIIGDIPTCAVRFPGYSSIWKVVTFAGYSGVFKSGVCMRWGWGVSTVDPHLQTQS